MEFSFRDTLFFLLCLLSTTAGCLLHQLMLAPVRRCVHERVQE
jgi:hypothetical protein